MKEQVSLNNEIWMDIKITCGNYSVSNMGRVKSNNRVGPDGRLLKSKILHTYKIKPRGYHTVVLMIGGKKKHFLVHRLVYLTFHNMDINTKIDIDHDDNNPDNNTLDNLSALTHSENIRKSINNRRTNDNYTIPEYIGKLNGKRGNYKQIIQVDINGDIIAMYNSLIEAENKTGIRKENISRALRGVFKTSGGFYWMYK